MDDKNKKLQGTRTATGHASRLRQLKRFVVYFAEFYCRRHAFCGDLLLWIPPFAGILQRVDNGIFIQGFIGRSFNLFALKDRRQ